MKIAGLILLLGCLLPQDDDRIRGLIDNLSDDQIRVREKAALELAELGRVAIPALERLKQSGDIELRSRAGNILKRIAEGEVIAKHWRRGPRITLSLSNAPLSQVLESLEKQAKDEYKVDPELTEPVSIELKDATVWDAVEAVCRLGPELTWESDGDALHFMKKRRPAYPSKRQAEFATWIDGITFMRDFDFTGNPRQTFSMTLVSAWEAGVQPVAVEQRVTEILDEDGNNLMPPDRYNAYGVRMDSPKGRTRKDIIHIPLAQNAKIGKKFSRVRGTAAFVFPKAYEELSVDLKSSSLAPVVVDRMTVAVRNFRMQGSSAAFEVILTTSTPGGDAVVDRLPSTDIVVIDDQGASYKPPSSSRSHSYSGTAYTIHENLQVPLPEGRTAVTLKLRILKDVLEKRITFDYENIALE